MAGPYESHGANSEHKIRESIHNTHTHGAVIEMSHRCGSGPLPDCVSMHKNN
jgi:hypothetical protein